MDNNFLCTFCWYKSVPFHLPIVDCSISLLCIDEFAEVTVQGPWSADAATCDICRMDQDILVQAGRRQHRKTCRSAPRPSG